MSEENSPISGLGSFDFAPAWAKEGAGIKVGQVRPARAPAEERPRGGAKPFAKRPFVARKPRFEERVRPLQAAIKVLPETKALGTIIRKIQGDFHAYKLKDLAYFFLENPRSVLLKVEPQGEEKFHQCKVCSFASANAGEVAEHIVRAHLGEYYDSQETEVEPPKGNFNCVARCSLSGVLLGPPNIHEFNSIVREMIRTRYPEMSEAEYRSRIEMVREPEVIETWRAGATRRTMFYAKGTIGQEGAVALTREQAEGEFRRNILPTLLDAPRNLMITADMALASPSKPLALAVQGAVEAERRAPIGMCFALRGAFHHRKLKFFRANDPRGPEFVTNMELREFDVAHAIPELASVATFVAEHPCCDKSELPGGAEAEKHLNWLATTGHVVAFTNGVYSSVEKFPKYGPQWKKRNKAEEPKEEPKETAEEPKEAKEEVKDETAAQLAE